eukprot:352495-Chlamydomonas_euryale.AAC.3
MSPPPPACGQRSAMPYTACTCCARTPAACGHRSAMPDTACACCARTPAACGQRRSMPDTACACCTRTPAACGQRRAKSDQSSVELAMAHAAQTDGLRIVLASGVEDAPMWWVWPAAAAAAEGGGARGHETPLGQAAWKQHGSRQHDDR